METKTLKKETWFFWRNDVPLLGLHAEVKFRHCAEVNLMTAKEILDDSFSQLQKICKKHLINKDNVGKLSEKFEDMLLHSEDQMFLEYTP